MTYESLVPMVKRCSLITAFTLSFASAAYVSIHYYTVAAEAHATIKELQAANDRLRDESKVLRQRMVGIDATIAAIRQENARIKGTAKATVARAMQKVGIDAERELRDANGHKDMVSFETALAPVSTDSFAEAIVRVTQTNNRVNALATEAEAITSVVENGQAFLAAMPSLLPTRGWLSSGFGNRPSPFHSGESVHKGVDLAADIGTPIYAPADGIVRYAGKFGRFGNYVSLMHGQGFVTKFAHTSELFVRKGDHVVKGQKIAAVGNSGRTTGPHLHYEVWYKDQPLNPEKFFPKEQLASAPHAVSFLTADAEPKTSGTAMGGDGDWQPESSEEPGISPRDSADLGKAERHDVMMSSHPFGAMFLSFAALMVAVALASGAPLPEPLLARWRR